MRWLRIIIGAVVLTGFMLGFVLPGHIATAIHGIIGKMQFFPALQQLSTSHHLIPTVILVPVFTVIFGRIYCSVICPLGIFQDIFIRRKKKFQYRTNHKLTRWVFPAVIFLLAVMGIQTLLNIFEPFATAGRIGNTLFHPAAEAVYRAFVQLMKKFDIFLTPITSAVEISALILISLQVIMLIFMAFFRGRLYCNAICPVGAVLSIFARYSLLGIKINRDKCVSCGLCRNACKAECINLAEYQVDADRCVSCFSCLGKCPTKAISYGPRPRFSRAPAALPQEVVPQDPVSRRDFLTMSTAAACCLPLGIGLSKVVKSSPAWAISPPGSGSVHHFNTSCTACHLCVSACPENVLRPATTQYGLSGFQQPVLVFAKGYCDFFCNTCGQVCPNGAIKPLSLEEKQHISIGTAEIKQNICVAWMNDESCGACDEVCPTGAVHMINSPKGTQFPTVPEMRPHMCIGCGACENACPNRAIFIKARAIHERVEYKNKENQAQQTVEAKTDGFAF